jgi:uncharacterized protein YciW
MSATAIIERRAGVSPGSSLGAVLDRRAEIMALSQAAHDAVLIPRDPGGIDHALRAALAERMSVHLGNADLAAHYREMLEAAGSTVELAGIADPAQPALSAGRTAAIVRHVDMVTKSPRDASGADIQALREAGISEPDIVRISELVAFVNYQARVIAGLKLLVGRL